MQAFFRTSWPWAGGEAVQRAAALDHGHCSGLAARPRVTGIVSMSRTTFAHSLRRTQRLEVGAEPSSQMEEAMRSSETAGESRAWTSPRTITQERIRYSCRVSPEFSLRRVFWASARSSVWRRHERKRASAPGLLRRLVRSTFIGWRFVGWRFVGWRFVGWRFVGWMFVGWMFIGSCAKSFWVISAARREFSQGFFATSDFATAEPPETAGTCYKGLR